jgi:Flp pilus assembly protein TadG
MASSAQVQIVEIDGEEFDLCKAPQKESQLVVEKTAEITKNINYDLISAQTSSLSLSLRVAYLGVARFPILQVEVNKLSVDVTKLTDESVRVLQKFQRAAASINQSYIASFKYLMRKKEKFALMEFGNVLEKTKEMQQAVNALADKFGSSADDAQKLYDKVQQEVKVRIDTNEEIKAITEEINEIEKNIDRVNEQIKVASQKEVQAAEKMGSAGRRFLLGFISMVTFRWARKQNSDHSDAESIDTDFEEFQRYYDERMKLQEDLRKLRVDHQKKLLEKLEKSAAVSSHNATEIKVENTTLTALDCCVRGMRHTQATLVNVAEFWKRMSDMSSDFSPEKLKNHIELIQEEEGEERFEMYNDDNFREKVKRQQASWVAMAIASNCCLESINTCNRELHVFIGEHCTPEEAGVKLRELMGPFMQRTRDLVLALEVDQSKPQQPALLTSNSSIKT